MLRVRGRPRKARKMQAPTWGDFLALFTLRLVCKNSPDVVARIDAFAAKLWGEPEAPEAPEAEPEAPKPEPEALKVRPAASLCPGCPTLSLISTYPR